MTTTLSTPSHSLDSAIPPFSYDWRNRTVVLAAPRGPARRAILKLWLYQARKAGAATWLLSCALEQEGLWAGLAAMLEDLVPRIQAVAPELIERHSYELCLIVPRLRESVIVQNPNLTEAATEEEKVRNYPADRAYRSLHGIIDLLAEWHAIDGSRSWVIAADDFDRADALVGRFFAELLRRQGRQLGLTLLLAVAPGRTEETLAWIAPEQRGPTIRPGGIPASPSPSAHEWLARAREIEAEIAASPRRRETLLPALIHALEQGGAEKNAILRLKAEAMHLFVHRGLYEAAAVYASDVEGELDTIYALDPSLHEVAVNSLFFAYVPLGRAQAARQVVEREMLARTDNPTYLPRIYYLLAMLHARFLPTLDLARAEAYLDQAIMVLQSLPADALSSDRRAFLIVFMQNGLALIRVRQRRAKDAVALCREGIALLDALLRPEQHRLHRSVLVYNIAQVYAQTGPPDEAIAQFTAVMALDPNYSEYYNERGAVFLKMGQLDDAERDFRRAIDLSPPYAEVWTNLGQCYRELERFDDAIAAYDRALDLDPTIVLARVGRADAFATRGDYPAALADYTAALRVVPDDAAVLAARAVVNYEAGTVEAALADLDRAIVLAPNEADYYQNRAVALTDLGRPIDAAADLRTYLRLAPEAEDRTEVEARLAELEKVAIP